MTELSDIPRRRCEVAIRISADDVEGVIRELRFLEYIYSSEGMGHDMVSGNTICVDSEDPERTYEAYRAAVDKWIAERRAEKKGGEQS